MRYIDLPLTLTLTYWCGQQNSSTVDLVYYGQARRAWLNPENLLHIGH